MPRAKDQFSRQWITNNAIEICKKYDHGILTLRGLHYQLVGRGMTNSLRHYKRVVAAMIKARWEGLVAFEQFSDHDRETMGVTQYDHEDLEDIISTGKRQVELWMENFSRSRWENQPVIPEVWIEKKALQGVFQPVCDGLGTSLTPCKGYPSLTLLNEAAQRLMDVQNDGRKAVILYFGDYDATGEDIPRSIQENLERLGADVEVRRIALMQDQVFEMGLPAAPTKKGDSRGKAWDGHGQVELDAVEPNILQSMCKEAIMDCLDESLAEELERQVAEERTQYRSALKAFVNSIKE